MLALSVPSSIGSKRKIIVICYIKYLMGEGLFKQYSSYGMDDIPMHYYEPANKDTNITIQSGNR